MKTKIFNLITLSIIATVFLIGIVSASIISEWDFDDSNLLVDGGTGTLTISDSRTSTFPIGNAPTPVASMSTTGWDVADRFIEINVNTLDFKDLTLQFDYQASLTGPTEFKIQYSTNGGITYLDFTGNNKSIPNSFTTNPMSTFNFSTISSLNDNPNTKFRIIVPATGIASDSAGTFRIDNLLIQGTAIPSDEPDEITSCSAKPNPGNDLKVDIKDITVINGFGDDEEWLPLDEIEVEMEVSNDADEDMNDLVLEWGVYDRNKDRWYLDEEENDFNLKDGDEKTITVTFKLDDDVDELEDADFVFYAWANGELEDSKIDICASDSQDIDMIIEDEFVILTNIEYVSPIQCGTELQITADVWNIGDEDQDDVSVLVYNQELGINEKVLIGDVDAFEDANFVVNVEIPEDATEKLYTIKLEVNNEDNELYENDFDDEEAVFDVGIRVEGECGTAGEPEAVVSASLESGGQAGENLVVRATLTNTGNKLSTYSINAASYTAWAESVDVEPKTVILSSGDSTDILLTFKVKSDASGQNTFYFEALSGNELVVNQPVSVSIEPKSSGFGGITGGFLGDNAYLWGIGLLNVILVIIIIIVAVRVARK